MNLRVLAISMGFVAAACSSNGDTATPETRAEAPVTIGELDDLVITVASGDLSGEVIVIGEPSVVSAADGAEPRSGGGSDGQVEEDPPERNPLGGDDPEDGLMPDVVCMNLQDAQDEIQDHGVFFSKSRDASGEGRRQLWDRNWIVVEQSPAAGEPIGENEAVLSVVKDDEPSDC